MYYYERNYKFSRVILTILEFISWICIALGLLFILIGFNVGGYMGGGLARIVAIFPGLVVLVFAILWMIAVQGSRADIDNAEMTRDMLGIQRMHYKHVAQATGNSELSSFISSMGTRSQDADANTIEGRFKPAPMVPQKTQKGDTDTYTFGSAPEQPTAKRPPEGGRAEPRF